ncbi:MAG: hypothetical protein K2M48_01095 [Clostridiales bacterium]|nr:hypothetical protein [Clostridiales bacterium]
MKKILPVAIAAVIMVMLFAVAVVRPAHAPAVHVSAETDKLDAEAMQALENARAYLVNNDFSVKTTAAIKAKAFGIPHTQKVYGSRSVKSGVFTEQAESKSAFAKAAFKKKSVEGGYEVSRGEYKKNKFVYGKPKFMTTDEYIKAYGKPAIGLVRYEVDGTVLEAKKTGEGVYEYKLDAKAAAKYFRNEIKTLIGTKKHPTYSAVSFTMHCDGSRPVKVCTHEKFRADICGGTNCTATYVETFTYDR